MIHTSAEREREREREGGRREQIGCAMQQFLFKPLLPPLSLELLPFGQGQQLCMRDHMESGVLWAHPGHLLGCQVVVVDLRVALWHLAGRLNPVLAGVTREGLLALWGCTGSSRGGGCSCGRHWDTSARHCNRLLAR